MLVRNNSMLTFDDGLKNLQNILFTRFWDDRKAVDTHNKRLLRHEGFRVFRDFSVVHLSFPSMATTAKGRLAGTFRRPVTLISDLNPRISAYGSFKGS
jgi:hypothetical protein